MVPVGHLSLAIRVRVLSTLPPTGACPRRGAAGTPWAPHAPAAPSSNAQMADSAIGDLDFEPDALVAEPPAPVAGAGAQAPGPPPAQLLPLAEVAALGRSISESAEHAHAERKRPEELLWAFFKLAGLFAGAPLLVERLCRTWRRKYPTRTLGPPDPLQFPPIEATGAEVVRGVLLLLEVRRRCAPLGDRGTPAHAAKRTAHHAYRRALPLPLSLPHFLRTRGSSGPSSPQRCWPARGLGHS